MGRGLGGSSRPHHSSVNEELGRQRPLQRDRLFAVVHGNGGVSIVADRVRPGDLAKQLLALDDVQSHAFAVGRKNAEDHVVFADDDAQGAGLIVYTRNLTLLRRAPEVLPATR